MKKTRNLRLKSKLRFRGPSSEITIFSQKKAKKMSILRKKTGMLRAAHTKILYGTHSFLTTSRERVSDIASTSREVLRHAMRYQNSVTFLTTTHIACAHTPQILLVASHARASTHIHNTFVAHHNYTCQLTNNNTPPAHSQLLPVNPAQL